MIILCRNKKKHMRLELKQNLISLRASRGYSQENIANELGIDYTTYARYESGKTEMKASQLVKLAEFYNISVEELLYGKRYPVYATEPDTVNEQQTIYRKRKITVSLDVDGDDQTLRDSKEILNEINAIIHQKFMNT